MTPNTYGRDFAYCLKSHGGGKGHLYVFMVTFDALCPLLLTMQILFASVSY